MLMTKLKSEEVIGSLASGKVFIINCHGCKEVGFPEEEAKALQKKLQEKGAQNVLISMAGDGAILLTADGQHYKSPAPKGKLVNSVGAGDSMVAGFITGYTESNGDFETAFHMGVATGSASAFSENLATRPEVEALLKTII